MSDMRTQMAPTLAWLADRADLDDDARANVGGDAAAAADPGAAARQLLAGGRAADGIRVVACALPPREGIWWAWVSARHAAQVAEAKGAGAAPAVNDALAAVERWITQPSDDTRRAAWAASDVAGLESPAGAAAAAVFFSGGSIASPDVAPVPPPAGLHATMIAASVTMAAATDAASLDVVAGAYIDQATEIIKQLGGWDRAAATAKQYHDAQREQHEAFANAGKRQAEPTPQSNAARGG
jgi:uncharacterized protein DUF6931